MMTKHKQYMPPVTDVLELAPSRSMLASSFSLGDLTRDDEYEDSFTN